MTLPNVDETVQVLDLAAWVCQKNDQTFSWGFCCFSGVFFNILRLTKRPFRVHFFVFSGLLKQVLGVALRRVTGKKEEGEMGGLVKGERPVVVVEVDFRECLESESWIQDASLQLSPFN